MTDSTITCPKCGADIPLTEAVSHSLREELTADFEAKRAELNGALAHREEQLAAGRSALDQRTEALQAELDRQLEAERTKLRTQAAEAAEATVGTRIKELEAAVQEQQTRLQTAQQAELELRKNQRELEAAKQSLELEVARTLDVERAAIAEQARQQASEVERLHLAEKEKVITDLRREIDNLKQKSEQGSMQLQGETLELSVEADLRAAFPFDAIEEVKKGERGADLHQQVRTNAGLSCGSILWEAKRARNWSAQWPEKLRQDQRAANAELAVLVTTCPPAQIRGIGQIDGVWVCEPAFAIALAAALRQGLVSTAVQRRQETDRSNKIGLLYDHLCSPAFRHHVEAIVEAFRSLHDQLGAEQRAFAKQWKEREQQLHKAITHTAMLYGGIQGIAGRDALPEIATLTLET